MWDSQLEINMKNVPNLSVDYYSNQKLLHELTTILFLVYTMLLL